MICANCKKEIVDDALFCPYCGTQQNVQVEQKQSYTYESLDKTGNWRDTFDISEENLSKYEPSELGKIASKLISFDDDERRVNLYYLDKGMKIWRYAADHGDAFSAYNVGSFYLMEQVYGDQEILNGITYLDKASNLGFTLAKTRLANYYNDGKYVPKDPKKALELRLEVERINPNDAENLKVIGIYYGLHNEILNYELSKQYLLKAKEKGIDVDELLETLESLSNPQENTINEGNSNPVPAVGIDPNYAYDKADNMRSDEFCEEAKQYRYTDPLRAYKLLEQSAMNGNYGSYTDMAEMLLDGSLPKDENMAFKYTEYAANKGNDFAKLQLANCYLLGIGVTPDPNKAYQLFKESKNTYCSGDYKEDADFAYAAGKYDEALEYYEKAFLAGNIKAAGGICDICTRDGYLNPPLFAYYAYQGAKRGDPNCMNNLGAAFQNAYGVQENILLAMAWFKKAALLNEPSAITNYNHLIEQYGDQDVDLNQADFSILEVKPPLFIPQEVTKEENASSSNELVNKAKKKFFGLFEKEEWENEVVDQQVVKEHMLSVGKSMGGILLGGLLGGVPGGMAPSVMSSSGQASSDPATGLSDAQRGAQDALNHQYQQNFSRSYQESYEQNLSYDQFVKYKNGEDPFGY